MLEDLSKESALVINHTMRDYTTIRTGGLADYIADIGSLTDLQYAVNYCSSNRIEYTVIGRGSNLLVRDGGYRGVIIRVAKPLFPLEINDRILTVSAGESMINTVRAAVKKSLSGLEFLGAIPGTLGGAVAMNAGAHGGEISDCLIYTDVLYKGENKRILKEECGFLYRKSIFLKDKDYVITGAAFLLNYGDIKAMEDVLRRDRAWRNIAQPKGFPNAGSAFKRLNNVSAGELIDKCGLKGYHIGGAEVSKVHANFLINRGTATASDFIALMEHIEKRVYEQTGMILEREIEIIGED